MGDDEWQGSPLSGELDGPGCDAGPHLFLVKGASPRLKVIPMSFQHCCQDHGGDVCFGWIALNIEELEERGIWDPTHSLSVEAEGSLRLTP